MRSFLAAAAGVFMLMTNAAGQSAISVPLPAGPAVGPGSHWCGVATFGFELSDAEGAAGLKKCKRGDTVAIPAANTGAIGRYCDFSKPMVGEGGRVFCTIMLPERPVRQ